MIGPRLDIPRGMTAHREMSGAWLDIPRGIRMSPEGDAANLSCTRLPICAGGVVPPIFHFTEDFVLRVEKMEKERNDKDKNR